MQQTASKSDHLGPSYGPKTDQRSKKPLRRAVFEFEFLVQLWGLISPAWMEIFLIWKLRLKALDLEYTFTERHRFSMIWLGVMKWNIGSIAFSLKTAKLVFGPYLKIYVRNAPLLNTELWWPKCQLSAQQAAWPGLFAKNSYSRSKMTEMAFIDTLENEKFAAMAMFYA